MTNDDIIRVEQVLDVKLPEELKQKYMTSELNELDCIDTLGLENYLNDPKELRNYLIRDPDKLIKINRRVRKNGLFKKPFNANHFIIGYTWHTEYYFINLRDTKVVVYCAKNSKEWAYNPDDLSGITFMACEHTIDDFINAYPLNFLTSAKERKSQKEAGIQEHTYTAEETYAFLDSLRKCAKKNGEEEKE